MKVWKFKIIDIITIITIEKKKDMIKKYKKRIMNFIDSVINQNDNLIISIIAIGCKEP